MTYQLVRNTVLTVSVLLMASRLLFSEVARSGSPGDPLQGIAAGETQTCLQGKVTFMQVLEPEQGLGPAFNGTSCAGCHNVPAVGGSGTVTVMRAGQRDDDGKFHVLRGSTLFQVSSTPDYRCQVQIPPEANVIARRISSPLFGLGLIEAIPDETLLALEHPENADEDGTHGRAAIITDVATGFRRVGKFGWKAQHATLLAFAADAYRSEMGITNELFPDELAAGVDLQQLKLCDLTPDPEAIRDRKTG